MGESISSQRRTLLECTSPNLMSLIGVYHNSIRTQN
ncbi:MAG: hypothetical protein KDA84_16750 [Planctomycetaceae bacterium]|nr:hypothetical protein [Planctomycetaceae bacterium]